ncbi:hypothetical protein HK098_007390 [Nowakowskiella sp. JEL0407]|nr:hypothetical protein HK098_007390 [Nowakowskiella sp. JEL0407]
MSSPFNKFPIISQVKSLVHAIQGDMESARKTQDDFSKQCIGVSQCRSIVESAMGNNEAALQTQKEFIAENGVESIPVLSQIVSVAKVIGGDTEGALKTQDTFSKTCVGVSQCRSLVAASMGNMKEAEEIQKEFLHGPGLQHAVVVASAVAAPIIATGAVAAIGFGEGGIVAGSLAAQIMSLYGGSVPAGSLCAILQSMGAIGMTAGQVAGTAGTAAVVANVAYPPSGNCTKGDETITDDSSKVLFITHDVDGTSNNSATEAARKDPTNEVITHDVEAEMLSEPVARFCSHSDTSPIELSVENAVHSNSVCSEGVHDDKTDDYIFESKSADYFTETQSLSSESFDNLMEIESDVEGGWQDIETHKNESI